MKKMIVPQLVLAIAFSAALYAADKNKPADRIDFTLAANEVTVLQSGSGSPAIAAQNAAQAAAPQAGQAAQAAGEYYPSLSFFEFDLLSIKRSLDSGGMDVNFRAGFGDYENFGFTCVGNTFFYMNDPLFIIEVGIDLNFSIYPLGNAPSGWYMGFAFGGKMTNVMDDISDRWYFSMPVYGETGYRLILGGFVADASFSYGPEFIFTEPMNTRWPFFIRLGIGWTFDAMPPKEKKAGVSEAAKPENQGNTEKKTINKK